MAYEKLPSVSEAEAQLAKNVIKPIYFLCGDDSYSIDEFVKKINLLFETIIVSDFDKAMYYGDSISMEEVESFASTFPFGSDKKLVIVKDFEKVKDKAKFKNYVKSPSDFAVVVLINNGVVAKSGVTEPYKSLIANGYYFEAKEMKEEQLRRWIVQKAGSDGRKITADDAQLLMEIVGESKSLIEDQLEKIYIFLGDKREINAETIKSLSTQLKAFNVFDLQNALTKRDKKQALKIAYNILPQSVDEIFKTINMLIRFFTVIAKLKELAPNPNNANINDLMKKLKMSYYQVQGYVNSSRVFSLNDVAKATEALLKADIALKSTTADHKQIMTVLISEII
ncbi:MAG: DNA polymerase III subunit delta [Bacteroidota bacterium]|nr:DNA polymerase III subunit delta [Bacteroidota bacterium]